MKLDDRDVNAGDYTNVYGFVINIPDDARQGRGGGGFPRSTTSERRRAW